MKKETDLGISFDTKEKMKKNIVYVGIFSIIMIFAGLTSAYIVSMGGSFWLKFPFPKGFFYSTAAIVLSSLTYFLAVKATRKDDIKMTRIFMVSTLILGILFCVFQYKGYKQLSEQGAYLISPITVVDGKYGDYYEVKQNGSFVEIDGNDFFLNGKLMTESQWKALQGFFKQFETIKSSAVENLKPFDPAFTLYYKSEPLQLVDGKLIKPNGEALQMVDYQRLQMVSWNIRDGRGDFFHKGKYGKDFSIYFKGKELNYKNRALYYQGKN